VTENKKSRFAGPSPFWGFENFFHSFFMHNFRLTYSNYRVFKKRGHPVIKNHYKYPEPLKIFSFPLLLSTAFFILCHFVSQIIKEQYISFVGFCIVYTNISIGYHCVKSKNSKKNIIYPVFSLRISGNNLTIFFSAFFKRSCLTGPGANEALKVLRIMDKISHKLNPSGVRRHAL